MNTLGLLVLGVSAIGIATEWLTQPKQRDQLDIPKGDWLTVLLGVLPSFGVLAINLQCWIRRPIEPHWGLTAVGLLLCAGCILFRGWGKHTLGYYYTFAIDIRNNHTVINHGPYRLVRHPLYLGALLGIIGFPLLAQSWFSVFVLSIPVGFVYGLRLFLEEKFLFESLGQPYRAYADRTARLIPFVW